MPLSWWLQPHSRINETGWLSVLLTSCPASYFQTFKLFKLSWSSSGSAESASRLGITRRAAARRSMVAGLCCQIRQLLAARTAQCTWARSCRVTDLVPVSGALLVLCWSSFWHPEASGLVRPPAAAMVSVLLSQVCTGPETPCLCWIGHTHTKAGNQNCADTDLSAAIALCIYSDLPTVFG